MTTAFVLMTAMPPTKGHMALIDFANALNPDEVKVIFTSQPSEPFTSARYTALVRHAKKCWPQRVSVEWVYKDLPQDPNTDGFWDMWHKIMKDFGAVQGDYYVSSELYGAKLAEILDGVFMPFDPARELLNIKATPIRENPIKYFSDIAVEFQPYLRTNVVVWGAESTGKTTLSKELAGLYNGHWLYEYARTYLESTSPEISVESMTAIYKGQFAAEVMAAKDMIDKPYLFQDTDLFTTIGYWEQPHWADTLGPVPEQLLACANAHKADLYIMPRSNIPFEEDPLRYGGDHRESPDAYWLAIADKYNLPLVILNETDRNARVAEAWQHVKRVSKAKTKKMFYDRGGM